MIKKGVLVVILVLLQLNSIATAVDLIVDTTIDSDPSVTDGKCSLREAIEATNTNTAVDSCPAGTSSGSDSISFFVPTPATITLESQLIVSEALIIEGLGPNNLTIDANNNSRHFNFNASPSVPTTFNLSHIRLINGQSSDGGSISSTKHKIISIDNVVFEDNTSTGGGGAISITNELADEPVNLVTKLSIRRSVFLNNETQGSPSGGAVRAGIGSELIVKESTFANNSASHINGNGGAIHSQATSTNPSVATIEHSTFNGNSASNSGGAISGISDTTFNLKHVTIVGNTADSDASGLGDAGGILVSSEGSLIIENSIIANNSDLSATLNSIRPDISVGSAASAFTTNGYNFISTDNWSGMTASAGTPNTDNDFIGTNSSPLDPLLLPLADNGGVTQTMAVPDPNITLSLVVDNGNCPGEFNDQRTFGTISGGVQRAFDVTTVAASSTGGNSCDIGAYEFGTINLTNDRDFDAVSDNLDDCPDHFNPDQDLVCEATEEQDELCFAVKTTANTVASVCL